MADLQVQKISVELAYTVKLLDKPAVDPHEEAHEFPLSAFKSTGELAGLNLPGKLVLGLQVVGKKDKRRFVLFRLKDDADTAFHFDQDPNLKATGVMFKIKMTLSDLDTGQTMQVANAFPIFLKDDNRSTQLPNVKLKFQLRRDDADAGKYSLTYDGQAGPPGGPPCVQLNCFNNPTPAEVIQCVFKKCYGFAF